MSMAVIESDRIDLIGGETQGATVEGGPFGLQPDLYPVGKIGIID